jgi:methionyl aminopeptidase
MPLDFQTMTTMLQPGRISPTRPVPADIPRPEYVGKKRPWTGEPDVKDADTIERMRVAGRLAAQALAEVGRHVTPGVTTDELDRIGHEFLIDHGAYPSTLGYRGYPKSLCTSLNEVICHGIPDDTVIADGDIVNVDITAYLDGVHGDTNATFLVGEVDETSRRLVAVTSECLELGIAAVRPGRPISDIGQAIERHAGKHRFGVVRTFVGHGIGERFHGAPSIPHYFTTSASTEMEPGMTFTIEPMITVGSFRERVWDDGWTAVTTDGSRTAQFEHMMVVTDDGVEVLTR